MSKLNSKQTKQSKPAAVVAKTTEAEKPAKPKLTARQKLDRTLAYAEKCLGKGERVSRHYGLDDTLASITRAVREVFYARECLHALPADWAPPAHVGKGSSKPTLEVGTKVAIRDKHVAAYCDFMPTTDLTVTRVINGKAMLKAADGTGYGPIARGHLIIAAAAPAPLAA